MMEPQTSHLELAHPERHDLLDVSIKAQMAFLDSLNHLTVGFNHAPASCPPAVFQVLLEGNLLDLATTTLKGTSVQVHFLHKLDPEDVSRNLQLKVNGTTLRVYARDVLNLPEFTCLDPLGIQYTPEQTNFRVWTPVASKVEVLLFAQSQDTVPEQALELTRGQHGVWSGHQMGDWNGKFYQLRVTRYGQPVTTVDPYSIAASDHQDDEPLELAKSAIVDLKATHPEGWDTDPQPTFASSTDVSVYEVHVRDFTVHESSGVDSEKRGKYLGMVQPGTRVPGTDLHTGLDHLKKLGVNAVQLLPVYDFHHETRGAYNWGYDPYLYNVPEAQYSTQPEDPITTIKEFKLMVKGLHEAGLGVIMDVVYNHTRHTGERSPFDQLVPFYYYRTSDDGHYLNDTGVGNVLAVERPMVRQFVIDSLKHWVREYHIQGFRFDLMGTFTHAAVQEITDQLTAFKPDIVMYGEPWTGGGPIHFAKGAQKGMRQGVFNDDFRDRIAGHVFSVHSTGFIQGDFHNAAGILQGLQGSIHSFAQQPTESTNYASSHDNYVLWDRLKHGAASHHSEAVRKDMQKMAAALVFLAQGLAFMTGGEELARTKQGHENSYNAGDGINAFDWTRLKRFSDLTEYFSNIIRLRAQHPVFRLPTRDAIQRAFQPLDTDTRHGLVGFVLDAPNLPGESWRQTVVLFNGSGHEQDAPLPEGTFHVHVRGEAFSDAPLETVSGSVKVPARSTLIAASAT